MDNPCQCIDCGGSEPSHSSDCTYMNEMFGEPAGACPSCHGLNISCPDGCGRDPMTGELNGTRLGGSDVGGSLADQRAPETPLEGR